LLNSCRRYVPILNLVPPPTEEATMTWRFVRAGAAGMALGAGLLAGVAAPASAAATIDPAARAAAAAAITARLGDLNAAVTLVKQTSWLSPGDNAALLTELNGEIGGLSALATTIQNETGVTAFQTEAAGILSQYRVYSLVLPQVHLVRAVDQATNVILPDLQHLFQQEIQLAQERHKDSAGTVSAISDLATQIANLQAATNGLSAMLVALTPAQWNTDNAVLAQPRQLLDKARHDAGLAVDDIKAVGALLK
jgi:hypothetical protein